MHIACVCLGWLFSLHFCLLHFAFYDSSIRDLFRACLLLEQRFPKEEKTAAGRPPRYGPAAVEGSSEQHCYVIEHIVMGSIA